MQLRATQLNSMQLIANHFNSTQCNSGQLTQCTQITLSLCSLTCSCSRPNKIYLWVMRRNLFKLKTFSFSTTVFPVTDVNNQPKLQFPTPFPQTFGSFHKISMTTYKALKYTYDLTSKNEAREHLFWSLFPSRWEFIIFTDIFGIYFQNGIQALVIEELLTICSLEARRWRWRASIVNFGKVLSKNKSNLRR